MNTATKAPTKAKAPAAKTGPDYAAMEPIQLAAYAATEAQGAASALQTAVERRAHVDAAAKELRRRNITLPAMNQRKRKYWELLAQFRETLAGFGLASATVDTYCQNFRIAVNDGSAFTFNRATRSAPATKGADSRREESDGRTTSAPAMTKHGAQKGDIAKSRDAVTIHVEPSATPAAFIAMVRAIAENRASLALPDSSGWQAIVDGLPDIEAAILASVAKK